jgi:hypothetical protein
MNLNTVSLPCLGRQGQMSCCMYYVQLQGVRCEPSFQFRNPDTSLIFFLSFCPCSISSWLLSVMSFGSVWRSYYLLGLAVVLSNREPLKISTYNFPHTEGSLQMCLPSMLSSWCYPWLDPKDMEWGSHICDKVVAWSGSHHATMPAQSNVQILN